MISAMRSCTIGVSDLAASLRLFHEVMGLQIETRGPLSDARRAAWQLPADCSGEIVELSCAGYPIGRIRLLALTPKPTEYVRLDPAVGGSDSPLDIGVKAVDFYVAAPIERPLAELTAAGCVARSAPVRHVIGDTESEEVVLFGPDHVPLLIMIGHRHSPRSMRAGTPHGKYSEVPTISVVAGDPALSRRFYGDGLGLTAVVDDETPAQYRDLVCKLTGAPPGTRIHWLLYQDPNEPSGKILLVHFIGRPGHRLVGRMHPSRLGVGLFQHSTPDLQALQSHLVALDAQLVTPMTTVDGERLLLVRGPNEELLEITER
ncbi:MAG: hypothetical protein R3F58_04620 [Steroidobacteraceae bacterium]